MKNGIRWLQSKKDNPHSHLQWHQWKPAHLVHSSPSEVVKFYLMRLQKLRLQACNRILGPGRNYLLRVNLGNGWTRNIHCSKSGSKSGPGKKWKGKTNLVQRGKDVGEGKKQGPGQTLEGNPDQREGAPRLGKLSWQSCVPCCFLFPQVSAQLSLHWVRPSSSAMQNDSSSPHTPLILPICLSCFILPHSTFLID